MSDFTSEFWNFYVIGIVVLGLLACLVLLWSQGSVTYTVGKTTGHSWDENLEEYNNPLPRWWSLLFYITVVFAIVYLVLYPGLGKFPGIWNWSSAKYTLATDGTVQNQPGSEYQNAVDAADKALQPKLQGYLGMDIPTLAQNREAMEMGKRMFQSYCVQCHAANAKGTKGFPDLTNNDWQWGGTPEQIKETISNGRMGVMTPHAEMDDGMARDIANYVLSLSGNARANPERVARGEAAFMASDCLTCHDPGVTTGAPTGRPTGNPLMGSPNLTDSIWLYTSANEVNESVLAEIIKNGRQNQMPAWEGFLREGKVHLLAAYVYSLSNK